MCFVDSSYRFAFIHCINNFVVLATILSVDLLCLLRNKYNNKCFIVPQLLEQ